ncbi:HAD family hydrolase [Leptolyngbya sp. AN02str]|uniref:HAD family hydrolase n=1 Tax=Leptolyngbya sp. AN02str TaxID=3423363 RepID=UPI003D30EF34
MEQPTILALDFDGVLCDGLAEYFQTAWRAYRRIWSVPEGLPIEGLESAFGRLRPVVETGWEMPLVLHALLAGISEAEILQHWSALSKELVAKEGLSAAALGQAVDGLRDEWISQDVESWLALHRLYPGVGDRLKQILASDVYPIIISTKEGRFIRELLQGQGVDFPRDRIIGKEVKQPKPQTLRDLKQQFGQQAAKFPTIWFVEDRLKTLQGVAAQPDLEDVQLFLADWGYNTESDRTQAQTEPRMTLISLVQFGQPYTAWK